jgi:hypothetical protein
MTGKPSGGFWTMGASSSPGPMPGAAWHGASSYPNSDPGQRPTRVRPGAARAVEVVVAAAGHRGLVQEAAVGVAESSAGRVVRCCRQRRRCRRPGCCRRSEPSTNIWTWISQAALSS